MIKSMHANDFESHKAALCLHDVCAWGDALQAQLQTRQRKTRKSLCLCYYSNPKNVNNLSKVIYNNNSLHKLQIFNYFEHLSKFCCSHVACLRYDCCMSTKDSYLKSIQDSLYSVYCGRKRMLVQPWPEYV